MSGTLFVVATPIGNLEDITARALRVLREVALIAAEDTRHTARLLTKYGITTPSTSLHEHNEAQKTTILLDRLKAGDAVALVTDAGTPTVSDPGHRLVRAALAAKIKVVPVPGPSAALAALSASGLSSDRFSFLGFPPTKPAARRRWFERLKLADDVVVFFEAPHRLRSTLNEVRLILGERQIIVARELTKAHEELVIGPISEVLERLPKPRGEFSIVIDCRQSTNTGSPDEIPDTLIIREFRQALESGKRSKRQAAAHVATNLGLSTNYVYSTVERAGKSIE